MARRRTGQQRPPRLLFSDPVSHHSTLPQSPTLLAAHVLSPHTSLPLTSAPYLKCGPFPLLPAPHTLRPPPASPPRPRLLLSHNSTGRKVNANHDGSGIQSSLARCGPNPTSAARKIHSLATSLCFSSAMAALGALGGLLLGSPLECRLHIFPRTAASAAPQFSRQFSSTPLT
jgi:hypothetical protein